MSKLSEKQALAKGRDEANVIHWRRDRGDVYRVWRSWWGGDEFEVIGSTEFQEIGRVAKILHMRLIEAQDD